MILKLLNAASLAALLGTAGFAYTVKYDTLYRAEAVKKLERRVTREREAIAVLRAEWQHLNKPERLQALADRHLDVAGLQARQIVRAVELPDRRAPVDGIGQKLEALLGAPTTTGTVTPDARRATGRTPGATTTGGAR